MSSAHPLHALRALLAAPAPTDGVVVRVTATQVEVATVQGLVTARADVALQPGQRVRLRHGVASPATVTGVEYAL